MKKAEQRQLLLAWYDSHRRDLPWRARPGDAVDPYPVWLSEIMLQQTTVVTVKDYFRTFLEKWPTVADLAAAPLDDVLHAWAGLGYYARARNLHKCAGVVAHDLGGVFPSQEADLLKLPGVGAYTAAALAAIAFGRPAVPVDGNVVRVMSRLHALAKPLPRARVDIDAIAQKYVHADRPGDFAQALMDLGATVCKPRTPSCTACPWQLNCAAHRQGKPERYPIKAAKKPKPTRRGVVFWVERSDGAVLVERRPEKGLLGGMAGFPGTAWREEPWTPRSVQREQPMDLSWQPLTGLVRHTFTHFHLELTVWQGRVPDGRMGENRGQWVALENLGGRALPTVMKKVATLAMASDRTTFD